MVQMFNENLHTMVLNLESSLLKHKRMLENQKESMRLLQGKFAMRTSTKLDVAMELLKDIKGKKEVYF